VIFHRLGRGNATHPRHMLEPRSVKRQTARALMTCLGRI
jgi:hypothetical protein